MVNNFGGWLNTVAYGNQVDVAVANADFTQRVGPQLRRTRSAA